MSIFLLHQGLSRTMWMFFLVIGLWGAWRGGRGQGVDGGYLGAVAVAQLLVVVEVVFGSILWFTLGTAGMARPNIHLLYGAFALVFLPFIYLVVLRGDDSNRAQWVLSFATLFMFGIALRAIATAAP